jgi:hypothetical protein
MNKEKTRDSRTARSGSRRRPKAGEASKEAGTKETHIQTAIGIRLRAYYDEIARQPVPDRFVELLKQLDSKDRIDR